MTKSKARIFLVDDHPIIVAGLKELIDREPDLQVCGQATSAEDALQRLGTTPADLVVLDLSLPGTGGLELLKSLRTRYPKLPVLILSMHDEAVFAERALKAGARGYVMKHHAIAEIRQAIRRVLQGKVHLSERMSEQILEVVAHGGGEKSATPVDRLSDRELEVFEMIGRGLGTSEIARRLHLSVKTVETHRGHIKTKLGLKDAAELLRQAMHWAEQPGTVGAGKSR